MQIRSSEAMIASHALLLAGAMMLGTPSAGAAEAGATTIVPAEFTANVTANPYFSMPIGKKLVLASEAEDGLERIEILIPGWTKMIMGVETLVYWDRVYLDGVLVEDTRDYLAQHKNGDVWYFGEDVDNYEDGAFVDHEGAWLAGVDGAEPGIWIKAGAKAGDKYRQEYYAGKAEDAVEVLSTDETIETPFGKLAGCLKTLEWSPLFPATAHKYYCKEAGSVALEVDLVGPDTPVERRTELVSVDMSDALGVAVPAAYLEQGVESEAEATETETETEEEADDSE